MKLRNIFEDLSNKLMNTKSADYINAVYDNYMFDDQCESCGDSLNEEKSTCCGKCGHKHVKGTSCPKPYLTGKRHCRNRS